jgi:hypothetical protein
MKTAPRIKKDSLRKLVSHINRKDWWHVPPLDRDAYRKRGKFLASSFGEAELYGRPLDTPQRVTVANPLVGDEPTVCRALFGKVVSVPEPEEHSFLKKRLALDARMKRAASKQGYDSIVIMHPTTFAAFKKAGKIPRSIELNVLDHSTQEVP